MTLGARLGGGLRNPSEKTLRGLGLEKLILGTSLVVQ